MHYHQVLAILKGLCKAEPSFLFKAEIACEVYDNMDVKGLDEPHFDGLCQRIENAYFSTNANVDISELCHMAQRLIDDGDYEEADKDCIEHALEYATYSF